MIDKTKAKRLRDQALRLARSEGRASGNIEVRGQQRRIVEYERGRLSIKYVLPRYPDAPAFKTARPTHDFGPLRRPEGTKHCVERCAHGRSDTEARNLGTLAGSLTVPSKTKGKTQWQKKRNSIRRRLTSMLMIQSRREKPTRKCTMR